MGWTAVLDETHAEPATLRAAMPEVAKGFAAPARSATAQGALAPRTKEPIALAIGIAARCDGGIGLHVGAAIAETVAMWVYMGGGPAVMSGARALARHAAPAGGKA